MVVEGILSFLFTFIFQEMKDLQSKIVEEQKYRRQYQAVEKVLHNLLNPILSQLHQQVFQLVLYHSLLIVI